MKYGLLCVEFRSADGAETMIGHSGREEGLGKQNPRSIIYVMKEEMCHL